MWIFNSGGISVLIYSLLRPLKEEATDFLITRGQVFDTFLAMSTHLKNYTVHMSFSEDFCKLLWSQ